MFVKKLVERASKKHQAGEGSIHGLKAEDVNSRIAFHYGIPSGSSIMAYHPIQNILAIATNDGRIKLFGMDNTQALLQSNSPVPTKFLQFIENHGILLNITLQNHVEVWDIDKKELSYVHTLNEEITSYAVMQQSLYMYVGNHHGDISVLKLIPEEQKLVNMQYTIPVTESYGKLNDVGDDNAVIGILPQPMAETKRILILFEDGLISLWAIQESTVVYNTGKTQLSHQEPKKAVAACWACPFGSKLVVGYSNGEIFIWVIPTLSGQKNVLATNKQELHAAPNVPIVKLNLGYKTDRVPIVSLRWVIGDGKSSRLYINGYSDPGSYSFQVVVLNESSESRTIKLVLPLTETCLAMEFISCFSDRTKQRQNSLLLLSKTGQLYLYNDSQIEHYLLQCQSKSTPSLPNHFLVKLPFGDASITIAKLYTSYSVESNIMDEEQLMLVKKYSNLFLVDKKERDTNHSSSTNFNRFAKTNSLYITGHGNGEINFWDCSCPLLFPVLSIKQESEDGTQVTALHFDLSFQMLVAGDQNGLVRIITFKKEQLATENLFSFLQAKQGSNYTIRSVKVKGAIQSISLNPESKHLAVGTDKGFIFVFEIEGTAILYQKQFPSQFYSGISSLLFENCSHNGYAKNVLLIGMQDSSILAIEEDTGLELNVSGVHTKKPSRAILMQILDVSAGGCTSGSQLLFCSENAVRIYSLSHAIQGVKKVISKKKLSGKCCYASIVYGPSSDVGLVLVFSSGKVETRSLPDLSLLKDVFLRGFPYPTLKSCATIAICASPEGELVMVNGDHEILFFSVLFQKGTYRKLEYINEVYKKNIVATEEGNSNVTNAYKDKRKGIFGMVKDLTGNKSKHGQDADTENISEGTMEELSAVFSTPNFSLNSASQKSTIENDEDVELDIDDIDLHDTKGKAKEWNFTALKNQKLGKKLLSIKEKLMTKTDEKLNSSNGNEAEKDIGSVDQIKKKYGYAVNNESTSIAKAAESKLSDNVRKLQGISDRTSDLKDTAQSFQSLAKDLLRTVQRDKKSS